MTYSISDNRQQANSNWLDFNDADNNASLIPKGTLAKVILSVKPGGYNDNAQGWTDGWATKSADTGAVYLNCEFTVMSGQYAKRKVWGIIGLYTPKSVHWGNNGRSFIKAMLSSANNVTLEDVSLKAQEARKIENFGDLDGLIFLARIDIEKKPDGEMKNVIKTAITPENRQYVIYMGSQQPQPRPTVTAEQITAAAQTLPVSSVASAPVPNNTSSADEATNNFLTQTPPPWSLDD